MSKQIRIVLTLSPEERLVINQRYSDYVERTEDAESKNKWLKKRMMEAIE